MEHKGCQTCTHRLTLEGAKMLDGSYEDSIDICLCCTEVGKNRVSGFQEQFAMTCVRARKNENLCGQDANYYQKETQKAFND